MTNDVALANEPVIQAIRISDKSLANLIADADQMLERPNPVIQKEWWQDFRAALLELQERRLEALKN